MDIACRGSYKGRVGRLPSMKEPSTLIDKQTVEVSKPPSVLQRVYSPLGLQQRHFMRMSGRTLNERSSFDNRWMVLLFIFD